MRPRLERTTLYPSASSRPGGAAASAPASAGCPPLRSDPLGVVPSLTGRDRFIVSVLAEHQVLTTAQLAQLCFGRLDLAQRRLLRLVRLGVLDRFRWHALVGSEAWHYTLGPAGAALDAAVRGVEAPRAAELRRRALRLAASPRLAHLLGVNGFFCALAEAARDQPGSALVAWRSERRCAELYGTLVRPDAAGVYQEHGQRVGFFLEHDTGSEPLARVASKLAGYAELHAAGGPRHPVCFWLPSAARESHLRRLLTERQGPIAVATASAELAGALGTGPAGAIWLAAGTDQRRRLAGLADPRQPTTPR